MTLRLALYELVAAHRLDATATRRLKQAMGLLGEPPAVGIWLHPALATLAAGLVGFGVILAIAANWGSLGRIGQFALLQGLTLGACLGAWRLPTWRPALALLSLCSIGGLLAYFGQTYQTGADPWRLFALWSALTLPLCLGTRRDLLWAFWGLIAMTGVALWIHAQAGHRWEASGADLPIHALGWSLAGLLALLLGPRARPLTGTGPWAARAAFTLLVMIVTQTALLTLFDNVINPLYGLALVLLAAGTAWLLQPHRFDVYGASLLALALDVLLVAGLARVLFDRYVADPIGRLLLVGLVAAGLLAFSVSLIVRQIRQQTQEVPCD